MGGDLKLESIQSDKNARLSAEVFLALIQVFRDNGWEIPDKHAGFDSRFNRFCERLCIFNREEQKLLIELTRRFTAIDGDQYLPLIVKLLKQLGDVDVEAFKGANKFFIFPLIAPKDFGRTKSSSFVWYYFKDEKVKCDPVFLGKDLVFCEAQRVSLVENLQANEKLILVDDYIGSGETAVSAIRWFVDEHYVSKENIIILSIAAQSIGMQYIQQEVGTEVYTCYRFNRGISDYYTGDRLDIYTLMMNKIEDKLSVDNQYRFGYNKSEALISLIRTPNNTFPVFWKPKGRNKVVPFLRY